MIGKELLEQFRQGKKPMELLKKYNRNTVYYWYKVHLLLEIQRRIAEKLVTRNLKMSQKEYEEILEKIK